jgi:anaerobic ribonucleoside-triphosphate reductase
MYIQPRNYIVKEKANQAPAKKVLQDSERTQCEVWTRVMGYHRPVSSFNIGKKGEFSERVYFVESQQDACKS